MKRNLREQILFRIVRLSAEGYFQQEVVRMFGVSQECVSKILQRNRDTGRPHQWRRGGRKSFTTNRKGRQLVRVNGFISAPRLRVGMIFRFWKRLSVQSIVNRLLTAGYQSRRPARCPRRLTEGGALWRHDLWLASICDCGTICDHKMLQFVTRHDLWPKVLQFVISVTQWF